MKHVFFFNFVFFMTNDFTVQFKYSVASWSGCLLTDQLEQVDFRCCFKLVWIHNPLVHTVFVPVRLVALQRRERKPQSLPHRHENASYD